MVVRWAGVAAVFAAALYFASNYGGTIPYMCLYFSGAIPVVAGVYALWVRMHFLFYQQVEEKVIIKGQPVNYYFAISNEEKIVYDSIEVEFSQENAKIEGIGEKTEYHLKAGEKKEIRTKLFCNYRGEYTIGAWQFRISDYLHLFSIKYKVKVPLKVMVLPRIVTWKYEKEILGESFEQTSEHIVPNGEMDVQVRNYDIGDELRQIHWKASARAGKLMTRERCEEQKRELAIFFDLHQFEGTELEQRKFEDEMLEQLVAAVYACLGKNIPCTIIFNDNAGTKQRVENKVQWETFYQNCGRLQFLNSNVTKGFQVNFKELENTRHVLFLTGRQDKEKMDWIKSSFFMMETSIIFVKFSDGAEKYEETGIKVYEDWIE